MPPVNFDDPDPISATVYSNPLGRLMRAREGSPVNRLMMGEPVD
jgi:hypothetical protein